MPRTIAAAAVAMLLCLTASPSRAIIDINFLEIGLLKYSFAGTDHYGIVFDAGKGGASTCKLARPSDPGGSACNSGDVIAWDLSFAELSTEIGAGIGTDWTLTWDEGLATETVALIDFASVFESDWFSSPTITNPPDGVVGVSPGTSIDWTWPSSPELGNVEVLLFAGDLAASLPGPANEACASGQLANSPTPVSWNTGGCLSAGIWTALVSNENEFLRAVPDGLSSSGDPWVLDNTEWLAAETLELSTFEVVPEPTPAALVGLGLVGLAALRRRG